jgi:hypothetical protein
MGAPDLFQIAEVLDFTAALLARVALDLERADVHTAADIRSATLIAAVASIETEAEAIARIPEIYEPGGLYAEDGA